MCDGLLQLLSIASARTTNSPSTPSGGTRGPKSAGMSASASNVWFSVCLGGGHHVPRQMPGVGAAHCTWSTKLPCVGSAPYNTTVASKDSALRDIALACWHDPRHSTGEVIIRKVQ